MKTVPYIFVVATLVAIIVNLVVGLRKAHERTWRCETQSMLDRKQDSTKHVEDSVAIINNYYEGYRSALEHFALLHLELELKGERRTFGEMEQILYTRHKIK
jgi:hypothetical protein